MARRGGKAYNRKKGPRTESGQLSRSKTAKRAKEREARQWAEMTEREALAVGVDRRVNAGIPERFAKDPRSGTVQGYLFLTEKIDQDQYNVAEWYLTSRNKYLVARNSAAAVYDLPEGHSSSGDPEAYVEFCKSAVGRWNAIERVVLDAVFQSGKADMISALDLLLVRQRLQYEYVDPLISALNALDELYQGRKKGVAA